MQGLWISRCTHAKTHTACFCLLTSLNMVELASLNMVVDRLVHACWNCSWLDERTDLNNVVGTIMHDKSTTMFMHDTTYVVRE